MSINYQTKQHVGILQSALYELIGDKTVKIKDLFTASCYDEIEMWRRTITTNEEGEREEVIEPVEKPSEEALVAKFLELKNKKYYTALRKERDRRIAASDWMANSDVTMSDAWRTYRQALRDITTQTPEDEYLTNIVWPVEPQ